MFDASALAELERIVLRRIAELKLDLASESQLAPPMQILVAAPIQPLSDDEVIPTGNAS